jgi:hypothetical protein
VSDDAYKLPPGTLPLLKGFADALKEVCGQLLSDLIRKDVPPEWAVTTVITVLLDCAAVAACRTRRQTLGGEPDPELWQQTTQAAFDDAVKVTAAEMPK